jgi:hypothetical protein
VLLSVASCLLSGVQRHLTRTRYRYADPARTGCRSGCPSLVFLLFSTLCLASILREPVLCDGIPAFIQQNSQNSLIWEPSVVTHGCTGYDSVMTFLLVGEIFNPVKFVDPQAERHRPPNLGYAPPGEEQAENSARRMPKQLGVAGSPVRKSGSRHDRAFGRAESAWNFASQFPKSRVGFPPAGTELVRIVGM